MALPNENLNLLADEQLFPKIKPKQTWSVEEHNRFLEGLSMYGRSDAAAVSEYLQTRTRAEVHSHAEKYISKIDGIVDRSQNKADQYYEQMERQLEWNLLENGVFNEPNYEWCEQIQGGTSLILENVFSSCLKKMHYYVFKRALKYLLEYRLIATIPKVFDFKIDDNHLIEVIMDLNLQNECQMENKHIFINLMELVYKEDEILAVFLAEKDFEGRLKSLLRIMLNYNAFMTSTTDYAVFIVRNLAEYEKLDENLVCCLIMCLCMQSAMI